MIIEAGTILADVPGKLPVAGGQLQNMIDRFDQRIGNAAAAKRAKIGSAIIRKFADQCDPGIRLLRIEPDVKNIN